MTKNITKPQPHRWQPGESGNPKGRPRRTRALTQILQLKGDEVVVVGGTEKRAKEALAEAVWEFAVTGEVWLAGRRLKAENVTEWANVVKWLYSHIEPASLKDIEGEPELVVRVVRVEDDFVEHGDADMTTAFLGDGEETKDEG